MRTEGGEVSLGCNSPSENGCGCRGRRGVADVAVAEIMSELMLLNDARPR